jgi:hypothetical protein
METVHTVEEDAMACQQEYHRVVKRWIPATVAVFGLLLFAALVTSSSQAQNNGAHVSGASSGSSSHTSASSRAGTGTTFHSTAPPPNHAGQPPRPLHLNRYGGIYAVPVAVPYADNAVGSVEDDANYQGGPTIFDRRGSGAQSYIPPVANAPDPHSGQSAAPNSAGYESAQEITTLVFKDGRQIEVGNYAIVGRNLYDMSPGHSGKVPLADLDLLATQKQNDQRGVKFQVPPTRQAN